MVIVSVIRLTVGISLTVLVTGKVVDVMVLVSIDVIEQGFGITETAAYNRTSVISSVCPADNEIIVIDCGTFRVCTVKRNVVHRNTD